MRPRTTSSSFWVTLAATLILVSTPGPGGTGIVRAQCEPMTVERMKITAHQTGHDDTTRVRMRAALRLPFTLGEDTWLPVQIQPGEPPPLGDVPGPSSLLRPGGRCWRLGPYRAGGLHSFVLCPDRRDPDLFQLSARFTVIGALPPPYRWIVRMDGEPGCAATECDYTGDPCVPVPDAGSGGSTSSFPSIN